MSREKRVPRKTYNLKMFTQAEEQLFTKFQRTATYNRETPRELLLEMVREYIKANPVSVKLATETEVIEAAKAAGLSTTKAVLIKHRVEGHLNDFWRSNDDGRIVYELAPVLKFLKGRQGKGRGGWLTRNGNTPKRPRG